jgi:hypothetical protein
VDSSLGLHRGDKMLIRVKRDCKLSNDGLERPQTTNRYRQSPVSKVKVAIVYLIILDQGQLVVTRKAFSSMVEKKHQDDKLCERQLRFKSEMLLF